MTGEQDFDSLFRLKEASALAPALALLAAGLTSSVWLGYRFVQDRRWNRRTTPPPKPAVPPVRLEDQPDALPRAASAPSPAHPVVAPLGRVRPGDIGHPGPSVSPEPGVSVRASSGPGRRPDDTPIPNRLRPVYSGKNGKNGADRKKGAERRANVRRGGMTVPVRVVADRLGHQEMDGAVVDRSQGGLCLDLPGPVQEGQVFRLRSLLYEDVTPWVDVEAKSVRSSGGRWLVGCRFVSPLPWGLLLLFG